MNVKSIKKSEKRRKKSKLRRNKSKTKKNKTKNRYKKDKKNKKRIKAGHAYKENIMSDPSQQNKEKITVTNKKSGKKKKSIIGKIKKSIKNNPRRLATGLGVLGAGLTAYGLSDSQSDIHSEPETGQSGWEHYNDLDMFSKHIQHYQENHTPPDGKPSSDTIRLVREACEMGVDVADSGGCLDGYDPNTCNNMNPTSVIEGPNCDVSKLITGMTNEWIDDGGQIDEYTYELLQHPTQAGFPGADPIGDVPFEIYDQDGDGVISPEEYNNVNNALIERFNYNCENGYIPSDVCSDLSENLKPREDIEQKDIDKLWYSEIELTHNPDWPLREGNVYYQGTDHNGVPHYGGPGMHTEDRENVKANNKYINEKYGVSIETDPDKIERGEFSGQNSESWVIPPNWPYRYGMVD